MPTDTFYRLPEQKRARLTAAIRRELARVPFSEFSINRIVKDAGISRGSYYQYFKGSADLYAYILSDYRETTRRAAREALSGSGGDIFAAVLAGFDVSAAFLHSPEETAALRNALCCHPGGKPAAVDAVWSGLLRDSLPYVDQERLSASDGETLLRMMEILLSVLQGAVTEFLCDGEPAAARARLIEKLGILQRGMLRKDGREQA